MLGPEEKSELKNLIPEPLLVGLLPENPTSLGVYRLTLETYQRGLYQQQLTEKYVINDYGHALFPDLLLPSAGDRFVNHLSFCLESNKLAKLDSLSVTLEKAHDVEVKTREQNESGLWHSLRHKRITASKLGTVAERISNFETLVQKLQPSRHVQTAAMKRGIEIEG